MASGRIPSIEGGIQPTIVDAKGDLIVATAADTVSRLAVGTNNHVLTADSSTSTGLKWAAPASGGGMTLLSSTTLSGATTTISSIDQNYTDLFLYCNDASISSNAGFFIDFNTDTNSNNYRFNRFTIDPAAISGDISTGTEALQAGTSTGWDSSTYFVLHIPRYSVAENHIAWGFAETKLTNARLNWANFQWNSTSAITAISFRNGSTRTWSSGTVRLYGVK
jgi:hypothetical protein